MTRYPRTVKALATRWAVGLLLAALPVLAQTAVTPPGTGTEADPYRISELGHLVWMGGTAASSAGTYYALVADIDAAATVTWNDAGTDATVQEGFLPIGTLAAPFAGVLDGQGHVIRGLTVNRIETDGVGLFGWTGDGVVRRLGLESCLVGGGDRRWRPGGLQRRHSRAVLRRGRGDGCVRGRRPSGLERG